jgi:hypothetical protein
MTNNPKGMYVLVPMTQANGHTTIVQQCDLFEDYEEAVTTAQARLDRRSYNGYYIYKAHTYVRRTAPPIDIITL